MQRGPHSALLFNWALGVIVKGRKKRRKMEKEEGEEGRKRRKKEEPEKESAKK